MAVSIQDLVSLLTKPQGFGFQITTGARSTRVLYTMAGKLIQASLQSPV